MKKFDVVKLIGIAGTALGLVATLMSNYSQEKEIEKQVKDEVSKALKGE